MCDQGSCIDDVTAVRRAVRMHDDVAKRRQCQTMASLALAAAAAAAVAVLMAAAVKLSYQRHDAARCRAILARQSRGAGRSSVFTEPSN